LPHRTYIGRRVKKKFSQVIFASNAALKEDHPDRKKVRRLGSSINSYLGIMRHYRTYRLRRQLLLNPLHPPKLLKHGYIRVKSRVMTFVAL
jgi:hypothetical protein